MKNFLQSLIHRFRANPPPVVPVIRLEGVIATNARMRNALNLESVETQIKAAFAMTGAKAVALVINSPGGSPVQSALITKRIRDLAAETHIPVLAFAEDVAASGGYMLALAGDDIYAHDASIIGSIGVVSAGFGFPEALKKLGVERRLYTSGESKGMLDPFSPENEDDVAHLKALQSEIHEIFKAMVRDRRGKRLKGRRDEVFSGAFWSAGTAKKMGLIDDIGDMRAVLRAKFGEKVRIRPLAPKKSKLSNLLGLGARGGVSVTDGLATEAIEIAEEKVFWSRYGL